MSEKPLDADFGPANECEAPDDYRPLSTLDACPECGNYYCLYETAPETPYYLNPYEQEQFEQEHCHNIIRCSVCDFNSEDD
jgi:hypothetical protein